MKSCLVSSYIPPAPQHIPVDPRLLTYLKRNSKVIDTPGFGDSSGKDNQYIQEMMDILDNKLGYANTILLVLEGSTPRFSSGLEDMLKQMSSIFGEQWWDYMMIGKFYHILMNEWMIILNV